MIAATFLYAIELGHESVPASLLLLRALTRATICRPARAIESDWGIILPFGGCEAQPNFDALHSYYRYLDAAVVYSNVAPARAGCSRIGLKSPLEAAPRAPPIGWCSWYCHGPDVDESLM